MAKFKRQRRTAKKTRVAEGLMQGMQEALAHSREEKKLREHAVKLPGQAPKWTAGQIRNLRKSQFGVSQPIFAALLNVTTSTVRAWEQGQKTPSGAAARLLQLIAMDSKILQRLGA
jgi:DNA-binding transcriptional regulator YiaG